MSTPIGLFLTDFSREIAAIPMLAMPDEGADFGIELPEPAVDDVESRLAEARQEGFAQGEASARTAAESEHEALKADHKAALAEARRRWAVDQAGAFATQLRDGLATLESNLAEALADVLQPVLGEAVRLKALDELRGTIATLLAGDKDQPIRISGPEDLLKEIEGAIGPAPTCTFTPSDDVEVVLTAGDTTIRSSLNAWAAKVKASMRDER